MGNEAKDERTREKEKKRNEKGNERKEMREKNVSPRRYTPSALLLPFYPALSPPPTFPPAPPLPPFLTSNRLILSIQDAQGLA